MDLTKSAKTRATRAIEGVHLAYYERGGIRDTETKLDELRGSAAKHVYALAVYASEQRPQRAAAIEMFGELCTYAEDAYKKEHKVENLREVLPTWGTLKSNILTGVRDYGLDPRQYRSEGAFRVAKQKATPPPVREVLPARVTSPPALESPQAVDHMLATTIQQDSLRTLVAQIVFELEILKRGRGTVAAAEQILRDAMDALAPLVDQRKAA